MFIRSALGPLLLDDSPPPAPAARGYSESSRAASTTAGTVGSAGRGARTPSDAKGPRRASRMPRGSLAARRADALRRAREALPAVRHDSHVRSRHSPQRTGRDHAATGRDFSHDHSLYDTVTACYLGRGAPANEVFLHIFHT